MTEFEPTARDGESVRRTHWGNWFWTCRCGFEATCLEDVGGHRSDCPATTTQDSPAATEHERRTDIDRSMARQAGWEKGDPDLRDDERSREARGLAEHEPWCEFVASVKGGGDAPCDCGTDLLQARRSGAEAERAATQAAERHAIAEWLRAGDWRRTHDSATSMMDQLAVQIERGDHAE